MKYLVAFACFVAVASAQWGNQQQQQGNFLQQLLSAHMGQQNNMGQNMGQNNMYMGQQPNWNQQNMMGNNYQQQRPQQNNQGMGNNVLGSMLGNLLASAMMGNMNMNNNNNNNNMNGGQGNAMTEEMRQMQELMQMSMATEMMDMMRAYNVFKENEEEFGKAMYHLCYMVNATWVAARRYNYDVYNRTTEASLQEMEAQGMGMSEEEKMESVIKLMAEDPKMYEEIFFRLATWSCWAGQQYMDSAIKLDKLSRGQQCDH